MKLVKNGIAVTDANWTPAQALASFQTLERFLDAGGVDAENFLELGGLFSSTVIDDIVDSPTVSRPFSGQFIDNNADGSAQDMMEAVYGLLSLIENPEYLVFSCKFTLKKTKTEFDFKTSKPSLLDFITPTLIGIPILPQYAEDIRQIGFDIEDKFLDSKGNVSLGGKAAVAGAAILNPLLGIAAGIALFRGSKRKKKELRRKREAEAKYEIAERQVIAFDVPEGYEFYDFSVYGKRDVSLASCKGYSDINVYASTGDTVMIEPYIVIDTVMGDNDYVVWDGEVEIMIKRKV